MTSGQVLLLAGGILMGSSGALCLKLGAGQLPPFSWSGQFIWQLVRNPYIVSGFLLYLIPALIWVYLLARMPVSVLQPVMSLTYVVTPILAIGLLNEPVPSIRWIGIGVILVGVAIVARS